jgi:hypothetical protein
MRHNLGSKAKFLELLRGGLTRTPSAGGVSPQ